MSRSISISDNSPYSSRDSTYPAGAHPFPVGFTCRINVVVVSYPRPRHPRHCRPALFENTNTPAPGESKTDNVSTATYQRLVEYTSSILGYAPHYNSAHLFRTVSPTSSYRYWRTYIRCHVDRPLCAIGVRFLERRTLQHRFLLHCLSLKNVPWRTSQCRKNSTLLGF
jgi:hypothetical protein